MHDTLEDHDHGLAFDLHTIAMQQMERRRALAWLAGMGGGLLLSGCGGGGSGATSSTGSSTATSTTTTGTSSGTTSSGTATSGTTTSTTGQCVVDPTETAGPYPGDGTNTASGSTSNVLTQSGIVRSDVRPSFLSSTTIATGVQVRLTLTVVNVNNACAPLSGYAVYLWQCDRSGNYSLYTASAESYLRGVQVTDSAGQVTFTTIFPACYDGRWPHMHFEVFSSLAAATSGRNAALTSQFAMPSAVCSTVFADTTTYPSSASRFASVSLSSDNVFRDNTSAQLAAQTPTFNGSPSVGYTATVTIGISA